MQKMSKRITAFLLVFFMAMGSALANPGDKVSNLQKGQRAPFAGTLMNKQLASRIEAERKTHLPKKLCEASTKASVAMCEAEATRKLALADAKYTATEEKHKAILGTKQEQIDFLRKNYLPRAWYESTPVLIGIGVLGGFGLALGAAKLVSLSK